MRQLARKLVMSFKVHLQSEFDTRTQSIPLDICTIKWRARLLYPRKNYKFQNLRMNGRRLGISPNNVNLHILPSIGPQKLPR
jgi:hypothetical protein